MSEQESFTLFILPLKRTQISSSPRYFARFNEIHGKVLEKSFLSIFGELKSFQDIYAYQSCHLLHCFISLNLKTFRRWMKGRYFLLFSALKMMNFKKDENRLSEVRKSPSILLILNFSQFPFSFDRVKKWENIRTSLDEASSIPSSILNRPVSDTFLAD